MERSQSAPLQSDSKTGRSVMSDNENHMDLSIKELELRGEHLVKYAAEMRASKLAKEKLAKQKKLAAKWLKLWVAVREFIPYSLHKYITTPKPNDHKGPPGVFAQQVLIKMDGYAPLKIELCRKGAGDDYELSPMPYHVASYCEVYDVNYHKELIFKDHALVFDDLSVAIYNAKRVHLLQQKEESGDG